MVNPFLLACIQLIAILSSLYSVQQALSKGVIFIFEVYIVMWHIFSALSNFFGILSWGNIALARDENAAMLRSLRFANRRQFFAWEAVVVGYPMLVGVSWAPHYISPLPVYQVMLAMLPIMALDDLRIGFGTVREVVRSTQGVVIFCAFSHALLSYLTGNEWGLLAAGLMFLNIIFMSLPPDHNYFGISPGELSIINLSLASYVLCHAVEYTREAYLRLTVG